jgi:hypothetical protein
MTAPAQRLDVLATRAAEIKRLEDRDARELAHSALGTGAVNDAGQLPRLLWSPTSPDVDRNLIYGLLAATVGTIVLAFWIPKIILLTVLLLGVNLLVDDWANLRVAQRARALGVLAQQLAVAAEVVAFQAARPEVCQELADDLAALTKIRRRIRILALRDPFGVADLLRSALLLRLVILDTCSETVNRERARLRRVVLRLGELDAAAAVAELRVRRDGTRDPELRADGPVAIEAHGLVHPAIRNPIGNDVTLEHGGLVVTGSNMSGKSTFLRTIAINAICAQSICTTFGTWRAPLFRVVGVMRVIDDTATGMSKYAVEVAAIGGVVAAASSADGDLPALVVIDEPFSGTNPAVRVSIVVSVIEYLGARDLVIAATHDLEVAAQLSDRFARGYFAEIAGSSDEFDRHLRPGVSPTTNAAELLARAGYPKAILDDVARRVGQLPPA